MTNFTEYELSSSSTIKVGGSYNGEKSAAWEILRIFEDSGQVYVYVKRSARAKKFYLAIAKPSANGAYIVLLSTTGVVLSELENM